MTDINEDYEPTVEAGVINAISQGIGQWSREKGHRSALDLATWLEEWAKAGVADGSIFESDLAPLNEIAQELRNLWLMSRCMLIVTEVSEAVSEVRDHGFDGIVQCADGGHFGEELADVFIRAAEVSDSIGTPIGDNTVRKLAKNEKRPYKHGRVA